ERAYVLREPPPHALDRTGKVGGLAQPEHPARSREGGGGAGERRAHRGDAPEDHRRREAAPHAHAVQPASRDQEAEGVHEGERIDHGGVLRLRPGQLALQRGCEKAQDLAIHVVDRGDSKQQGADRPAVAEAGRWGGGRWGRRARSRRSRQGPWTTRRRSMAIRAARDRPLAWPRARRTAAPASRWLGRLSGSRPAISPRAWSGPPRRCPVTGSRRSAARGG